MLILNNDEVNVNDFMYLLWRQQSKVYNFFEAAKIYLRNQKISRSCLNAQNKNKRSKLTGKEVIEQISKIVRVERKSFMRTVAI